MTRSIAGLKFRESLSWCVAACRCHKPAAQEEWRKPKRSRRPVLWPGKWRWFVGQWEIRQKDMRGSLTNLFMRLFAMNLRRGWRSAVRVAWGDAIFTMDVLLSLPTALLLVSLLQLATERYPKTLGAFGESDAAWLAICVFVWISVHISLTVNFKRFQHEPPAVDSFNSTHDRFMLFMAGSLVALLCVLILFGDTFLHRDQGRRSSENGQHAGDLLPSVLSRAADEEV